jgi:hypothetical protein
MPLSQLQELTHLSTWVVYALPVDIVKSVLPRPYLAKVDTSTPIKEERIS